jgi:hypothetical protein
MAKPKELWKVTLTIWTSKNPDALSAEELAYEANNGGPALITGHMEEHITDPSKFPDTEFFNEE